jgi:GNAT superfamily N-acetyltransferase
MSSHFATIVQFVPGHTAGGALLAQVDAIFFAAAARTYILGPEREAFRERWLGRYLDAPGDPLFLALAGQEERVAGYLAGTLENAATSARFADDPRFRTDFAQACAEFPAHLHINVCETDRGKGLGAALIEAFGNLARAAGVGGMHVITGAGMRNVGFYRRCGFLEQARAVSNGQELVFIGRRL